MRMRTDALKDALISFEKNSENGSQSESPQLIAYHEKEEFEWREVIRGMLNFLPFSTYYSNCLQRVQRYSDLANRVCLSGTNR